MQHKMSVLPPRPPAFQSFLLGLAGFFALALPLATALAGSANDIEFKKEGEVLKTLSVDDLRAMVPEVSLKVFEPHEKQNRIYRVLPARQVFENVFGKGWEKAEEIAFTSIDGYQPNIPVAKFLAHDGYFAFANGDDSPFTLAPKLRNHDSIPLGPLYVVWDNIESPVLLKAGTSDMPYQIKSITLRVEAPLPNNMAPPSGSTAKVLQGFKHFRQHCVACHSINGEGGQRAPDLNFPMSVVEYWKPEYLKRWIMDPQSIRYNTTMPALRKDLPDRDRVTEELIAYLKAMSGAKRTPAHLR